MEFGDWILGPELLQSGFGGLCGLVPSSRGRPRFRLGSKTWQREEEERKRGEKGQEQMSPEYVLETKFQDPNLKET